MMKFSDRIGATEIKSIIQKNSITADLKNTLWNVYFVYFLSGMKRYSTINQISSKDAEYLDRLWHGFFKEPVDSIPLHTKNVIDKIREWYFYNSTWYQTYNFIEFHIPLLLKEHKAGYIETYNKILAEEMSAYRFINDLLVPIISESEINSIENAISISEKHKLSGVQTHLANSLIKLSDKQNPDYRNSIKESISAVESVCKSISADKVSDLSKVIRKFKDSIGMHSAFAVALEKLYGYTSDEDGIRHSILEEKEIGQEDAIFMLVTCSAFINYMIVKNEKAEKLIVK